MRLICPNCSTQYEIDAEAIPVEGREVQCGVCDHLWFQTRDGLAPDAVAGGTTPAAVAEDAPQPEAVGVDEPEAVGVDEPEAAEDAAPEAAEPEAVDVPEAEIAEPEVAEDISEPVTGADDLPAPEAGDTDAGDALAQDLHPDTMHDDDMHEPEIADLVDSAPPPAQDEDAPAPAKPSFSFDQVRQQLKENPSKYGWVQADDAPSSGGAAGIAALAGAGMAAAADAAPLREEQAETGEDAAPDPAEQDIPDAALKADSDDLSADDDKADPAQPPVGADAPDAATADDAIADVTSPETAADAVDEAMAVVSVAEAVGEEAEGVPAPVSEGLQEVAEPDDSGDDDAEDDDDGDNDVEIRQEIEESVRAALAAARVDPVSAAGSEAQMRADPNVAEPARAANDAGDDGQSFADRLKSRVEHAARAREASESGVAATSGVLQGASQAAVNAASSRLDQLASEVPQAADAPEMPDAAALSSSLRRRPAQTVPGKRALRPEATPEPRKSRFGTGFFMAVVLCLLLLAVYFFRPQISAAVPAVAPYLDIYAGAVDQARLWVQDTVGGLLAKVMPAGDAAE